MPTGRRLRHCAATAIRSSPWVGRFTISIKISCDCAARALALRARRQFHESGCVTLGGFGSAVSIPVSLRIPFPKRAGLSGSTATG